MAERKAVKLGIDGLEDPEMIGTGGFAVVYRAHQPAYRRTVAVKLITVGRLDEATRHRFERECQVMGSLSEHPSIVTLHQAGFNDEGRPYLVMAHMPGGSLEDRLDDGGPLPWEETVRITIHMAGALAEAHHLGVIHRDVKPSNILVSAFGEAQLSDFGIARIVGGPETRSGVITASLAYAAPEIIAGERPAVASDVYSLGATIHALLAGRPAFVKDADESALPLLARIPNDPVPDLRPLGIPSEVCEVVEHAMAKEPEQRQPSAAALGRDMQRAQTLLGLEPTSMTLRIEDGEPEPVDGGKTTIVARSGEGEPTAPVGTVLTTGGSAEAAAGETIVMPREPRATDAPPAPERPGRAGLRRWMVIGGGMTALLAVVGLAAYQIFGDSDTPSTDTATQPQDTATQPQDTATQPQDTATEPTDDSGRVEILPGEIIEADIAAPGEVDVVQFSGLAGDVAEITMTARAEGLDSFLRVLAPSGQEIAFDDDRGGGLEGLDARVVTTLPEDGLYLIEASSIGDITGPYGLGFGFLPTSGILPGETIEADIAAPGEVDVFQFSGLAGDVVEITMIARMPGLDSFLMMFSPSGELFATDDDRGGGLEGLDAAVVATLPEDGLYRVEASGHGFDDPDTVRFVNSSGPYGLTFDFVPLVGVPDRVSFLDIESVGDVDFVAFDSPAGTELWVHMVAETPDIDPFLSIIGPDGTEVAFDDDSGGGLAGLDAVASLITPTDGRYLVEASVLNEGTGPYYIDIIPVVFPPSTVSGFFDVPDEAHGVAFDGFAGEFLVATMSSVASGLDSFIDVFGPDGSLVASDDDSGGGVDGLDASVGFTVPTDGRYVVSARTVGGIGPYVLTLEFG